MAGVDEIDPPSPSASDQADGTTAPARVPLASFLAPLVVYLAGGAWLAFATDAMMSDAISRLANASYVVFSRDPHLAAVGFVWSPLPSLAEVPLLPLKLLWPELVTSGYVACVQSAVFMAGAAYQLRRYLGELAVPHRLAVAATLLFACNPLIAYYGMNGMSEASFVFFLVAASRYLSRWLATARPGCLARCGTALGLAYLCRYEAAAGGLAAMAVVACLTHRRAGVSLPSVERRATTTASTLIVALPFLVAFIGWALASWLIVGSPFAQLTSEYGNAVQTRISADSIATLARPPGLIGLVRYVALQWLALAPLGIVIAGLCVVLAVQRRDLRPMAPAVLLGAPLLFSAMAFLSGRTFGWLRFSIAVVPLVVLLAGSAIANVDPSGARWVRLRGSRLRGRVPAALGGVAILGLVVVGLPTASTALLDPYLGREESYFLNAMLRPDGAGARRDANWSLQRDGQVAGFLDSLALPEGAVLIDAADGFGVVLSSTTPRQFVITSDRDFPAILADPRGAGVRYLLTRPRSFSAVDAVADAHPGLFDGTSEIARLERVFTGSGGGTFGPWQLLRVLPA